MSAVIEVEGLSVGYGGGVALSEVTFGAAGGQSVAVLGPNGGGKTTLLRALVGELRPLGGTVSVSGEIAYLAQGGRTRLDFPVSAGEVALMGALARSGWWRPARRGERLAAAAALRRVGLEDAARTAFGALSAGQRQRVLLARALVQDAPVLLLDEPLAGVDPASEERIARLIGELRDQGRLLVVSTHDAAGARRFDRVLCLNRRQIAFGPPERCLSRATLEATYGSEIVVLEDGGEPVRAVAVQHHEH